MFHHEIENASTIQLPGSGYQEAYLLTCVFKREANRSHSGQKKVFATLWKIFGESSHSVLSLKILDLKSATKLALPAM